MKPASRRNPWTGISDWQEFLWDMKHPGNFFLNAWDGLRGRGVSRQEQWAACALCIMGVLNMAVGAVLVLR